VALVNEEIPHIYTNLNSQYRAHNTPQVIPILNHVNAV